MPRVTNAVASRKRRKRRLNQAKGFYGSRSKLFRIATEAVDRSMALSYAHRKEKKRDYRGTVDRAPVRRLQAQRDFLQPVHRRP
jgi:ribosomal protein L20